METKICAKCGEEKPLTSEYFPVRSKGSIDGFKHECKECLYKYRQQYYNDNREKILEQKKEYRLENLERITAYNKIWHDDNRESQLENFKQYYQENRERILKKDAEYKRNNKEHYKKYNEQYYKVNIEKVRATNKQYRVENKDKIAITNAIHYRNNKEHYKKYNKEYNKNNPDIIRKNSQRYEAKKKLLPSTLTVNQWKQIKQQFNNSCAYCGMTEEEHKGKWNERLHQEHFIALYNGGGYTHNNIIPACKTCNCSKTNKDFFEWYPTYEHYNIDREKTILDFLGYTTENTQQLALFL